MEINQIYELVNSALTESIGESALLQNDLGNLVDVGTAIFNANSFDKFTGKLVDKVGKVVFVNRKYSGVLGEILMRDGWEYGSVLQKISGKLSTAVQNESYELQDGASYDPNVFHKPEIDVKFFNKYVTFEFELSIVEKQLKSAFTGAGEMNAFISMLYNEIDKSLTIATENLARNTLNNMIAETMYTEYNSGSSFSSASHTRAVNLLYEYNQKFGTSLTAAVALQTPEFLRFAAYRIGLTSDRLNEVSTLFNGGGKERFTPADKQEVIMLSEFKRGADAYLSSDTFHNQFVALPAAKAVSYWQGSGTDYTFTNTGKVYCTTTEDHAVTATGVIAVMFDRDALGINCMERWNRSIINPKADFTNVFFKQKTQYYNDFNENFVVFFVA